MSHTPLVTDGSGPSPVSTGAQTFNGAKTFTGGVQGPGTVPIGAIMPVVNAVIITGGGYTIPPSGTVDANGWQLCDGAVIPGGNTLTGSTPNLSDGRYLRGATTSGSTSGSNSITIGSANLPTHTHGTGTLANAAEAAHTHGVGTYANAAEAAHTHGVGTYANTAEAAHTHGVGTYGNTAEAAHTHSSALPAHRHFIQSRSTGNNSVGHTHSGTTDGGTVNANRDTIGDFGGSVNTGIPGYRNASYVNIFAIAGSSHGHTFTTGGISANHTHGYGAHWSNDSSSIVTAPYGDGSGNTYEDAVGAYWAVNGTRATSAGSSHNHTFSGTSAAGSSHNHTFSGTSAAGASHNHVISGASAAGASHNHTISGSTDNGGFANTSMSIEPQYLNVRYLIRVK